MNIVQELFKVKNIFSNLAFTTTPVGPPEMDNYLIKIYIAEFDNFNFWLKKLIKRTIYIFLTLLIAFLVYLIIY
jgi:hypothetical protein